MKLLLSCLLTLAISTAFGQNQNVSYYKNSGIQVPVRDSADYIRVISQPDSGSKLYNVNDYYLNGQSKLKGKSRSSERAFFEDQCIEFYPDGKRKMVFMYKTNMLAGQQLSFYPNGTLAETRKYPDTPSRMPLVSLEHPYLIMGLNDSTGTPLITNGNGRYKKHGTETAKFMEEGDVKAGLRDGLWKGHEGDIRFEEQYSNGKLIKGTSVTAAGDSVNYTEYRTKLPAYQGGINNFYKFLSKNVRYPQLAVQYNIQGRVDVGFVVEKDGTLVEIASNSNVSPDLVAEAIRVMKLSPKWEPGVRYGRPVRVYYTSPIVFALGR